MIDYSNLLSYELRDFILFSSDTYFRLFSQFNQQWWWLGLIGALVSVIGIFTYKKSKPTGLNCGLLFIACSLVFIAIQFYFKSYAEIFQLAPWVGYALIVQGTLLIFISIWIWLARPSINMTGISFCLLKYAVLLHPLIGMTMDRPVDSLEYLILAVDPTLIAMVALVIAIPNKLIYGILVIPLLVLIVNGLIYVGMNIPQGILPSLIVIIGIVINRLTIKN